MAKPPALATLEQVRALVARGLHAMFAMKMTRDEARGWLERPIGEERAEIEAGPDGLNAQSRPANKPGARR